MRSGVDEKKPFHTPFAGLKDKLGDLPRGPEPREPERRSDAPKGPARAVVRLERKGRRGKEVTVVEQLGLPAAALRDWLKALKGALGCGGTVEGDALILQGDHRERACALLEERGVRRVSVSRGP
jgi:translation initiation factor 1